MQNNNAIKFFDMFSGIGGFRAGLERAGGFTCVGRCEINKCADRAYCAAHGAKESEAYYEDAGKIDAGTMPGFDLLTAGFPCQPFSIAGKRKGFGDARGTAFFDVARVARERRPPYLLLENVPGLLSHDEGRTFAAILSTLSELGYHAEWQVLNSKDFGVPQSRRRVYIVGYLDSRCAGKIFPFRETVPEALKLLVGGSQSTRVYDASGVSRTLTSGYGRGGLYAMPPGALHVPDAGPVRIRRLTPRECFRLQGFSEEQTDRLLSVDSDTQAYRQAGNAVTVNVIHAIGLRLRAVHAEAEAGKEEHA